MCILTNIYKMLSILNVTIVNIAAINAGKRFYNGICDNTAHPRLARVESHEETVILNPNSQNGTENSFEIRIKQKGFASTMTSVPLHGNSPHIIGISRFESLYDSVIFNPNSHNGDYHSNAGNRLYNGIRATASKIYAYYTNDRAESHYDPVIFDPNYNIVDYSDRFKNRTTVMYVTHYIDN
ncbi:hypothetical protein CHS0354_008356 [Potamilus streckersoni]|uniref:Uncharacterized protein n=1 Tax=Potamilus streckersoni TaxID=2493646 RepID=A0AAE0RQ58_9BIVA|nr:hypothetical protein CHS0354_008356 [Potamilus streckersoni]